MPHCSWFSLSQAYFSQEWFLFNYGRWRDTVEKLLTGLHSNMSLSVTVYPPLIWPGSHLDHSALIHHDTPLLKWEWICRASSEMLGTTQDINSCSLTFPSSLERDSLYLLTEPIPCTKIASDCRSSYWLGFISFLGVIESPAENMQPQAAAVSGLQGIS